MHGLYRMPLVTNSIRVFISILCMCCRTDGPTQILMTSFIAQLFMLPISVLVPFLFKSAQTLRSYVDIIQKRQLVRVRRGRMCGRLRVLFENYLTRSLAIDRSVAHGRYYAFLVNESTWLCFVLYQLCLLCTGMCVGVE